jgi:hypothetical protein
MGKNAFYKWTEVFWGFIKEAVQEYCDILLKDMDNSS